MGLLDGIFGRSRQQQEARASEAKEVSSNVNVVVGSAGENEPKVIQSFDNSNITFSGDLPDYDYQGILRDKQNHIVDLYRLADYFADADPIIRGIIYHVYVPYSLCSPWVLSGNEKTCAIYEKKYKRMRLKEKLSSIVVEYWKYGNVFCYFKDGDILTLPVHKCKIGNVMLNGTPIVDFDCQSIINEWKAKSYDVKENWIKDNNLENYFKGYPKEVVKAINENKQYAQLDPKNTFVLQGPKEGWQRYSVPFIASCLTALAKKNLISKWEDSDLNLAIRSFVHIAYGDQKKGADMLPNGNDIAAVYKVFSRAMSGFPLAVTNQLAKAEVIQPEMNDLFQWDKYKMVNNDILSAGGVSGILVSGISEDGSTFASAQISMQTAAARIDAARDELCEMMNKINMRLIDYLRMEYKYNIKEAPEFSFQPLDMSGKKALREACMELWKQGLVSTKTLMDAQGYSLDREMDLRDKEANDGVDDTMIPRDVTVQNVVESNDSPEEETRGRKKLDDDERTSDPDSARRGAMPKPSNEEGSMGDQSIS